MNKIFKSFLVFLLTYTQAFADSPVIWNGAWSKNLTQNGFLMTNNQVVTTDGLINYVKNGHGEVGTSGWSVYSDAAGTTPVDCTGGSPTETITQSTSSPLVGTGSLILTKGASNSQGQGASYPFTIDAAYKSTPLQIKVTALGSANYAASDVGIYIYDVTNSQLLTPAAVNIAAGTYTLNSFFVATTSTSYRLCVHTQSTNASSWTLQLDSVSVGPQPIGIGAAISDWLSYTPTISPISGYTVSPSGFWRRVGSSMEITGAFVKNGSAGTGGTHLTFALPSGYTIDTTKIESTSDSRDAFGFAYGYQVPATSAQYQYAAPLSYGSTTAVKLTKPGTNASLLGTDVLAGSEWNWRFTVPIAEWAGSANNSVQADRAVEEYASNNSTATTGNNTTSFVNGPAGATLPQITSNGTRRVRFLNPIQATDTIFLEVSANQTKWVQLQSNYTEINSGIAPMIFTYGNTTSYGMGIAGPVSGTTTDVDVYVGTYMNNLSAASVGAAGQPWPASGNIYWRLRKVSGGAMVGYPVGITNIIGYYQTKSLSANFAGTTPSTEVTDFRFNNLTIGRTYRATITLYVASGSGQFYMLWGSGSDPTQYTYWRPFTQNNSFTFTRIFVAAATSLKFYFGDSGANLIASDANSPPTAITGGATKTSFVTVEEVPVTVTTQWN